MTKAEELRNTLNSYTSSMFKEQYRKIIESLEIAVNTHGEEFIKVKTLRDDVEKYLTNVDGFIVTKKVEGDRDNGELFYTISIPKSFSKPTSHNNENG